MRRSIETNSSSLKQMPGIIGVMQFTLLPRLLVSVALLLGKGYESADDWAALLLQILFNAYLIFRPALGEIMDEVYMMI
jgi:hypothetical protein